MEPLTHVTPFQPMHGSLMVFHVDRYAVLAAYQDAFRMDMAARSVEVVVYVFMIVCSNKKNEVSEVFWAKLFLGSWDLRFLRKTLDWRLDVRKGVGSERTRVAA